MYLIATMENTKHRKKKTEDQPKFSPYGWIKTINDMYSLSIDLVKRFLERDRHGFVEKMHEIHGKPQVYHIDRFFPDDVLQELGLSELEQLAIDSNCHISVCIGENCSKVKIDGGSLDDYNGTFYDSPEFRAKLEEIGYPLSHGSCMPCLRKTYPKYAKDFLTKRYKRKRA